jgi:hypothetical protein
MKLAFHLAAHGLKRLWTEGGLAYLLDHVFRQVILELEENDVEDGHLDSTVRDTGSWLSSFVRFSCWLCMVDVLLFV